MRIEAGQHALDRRLDELFVRDLLDIVLAHPLEHVAEQFKLLQRFRYRLLGRRGCRPGHETHRCNHGHRRSLPKFKHHPLVLFCCPAAIHRSGLMGWPFSLSSR